MKVSVVLAVYNGAVYIKQQLQSILQQLDGNDEVVISDDNSTDTTVQIINHFNDPRIIVLKNEKSLGVIKNFERAIEQATGEIIFLADQDDFWLPGKVNHFGKYLRDYDTVVSDCMVVDKDLHVINPSYFELHNSGGGVIKNLKANTYLGCCMAFRKEVLQFALPFPEKIPMHDIWIGFIADLFFRSYFSKEKYLLYRRHGNNASTSSEKSNYTFLQKIMFRINTVRYVPLLLYRGIKNVWFR